MAPPHEGWFREVGESTGIDYETTDEATDMVRGALVSDYDRDFLVVDVTGRFEFYENARGHSHAGERIKVGYDGTVRS